MHIREHSRTKSLRKLYRIKSQVPGVSELSLRGQCNSAYRGSLEAYLNLPESGQLKCARIPHIGPTYNSKGPQATQQSEQGTEITLVVTQQQALLRCMVEHVTDLKAAAARLG